jgi:lipid-binding SYLF domain-containing protein
MKKTIAIASFAAAMLATMPGFVYAASDKAALDDRLDNAKIVIDEIMHTPDGGVPDAVMRNATCVAVVPSLKKGAFIVGAQYGQGAVTCKTAAGGWSAPVFIRMVGGSYGLQIGGEGTDLVLIAVNEKGMQDLLKSKFKIGADAAAVAGPVGRNAEASTDWKLNAELLTYSRSKGLLIGINLDGTSVSQNTEDNDVYYGEVHTTHDILNGSVPAAGHAQAFVDAVARYSNVSHDRAER